MEQPCYRCGVQVEEGVAFCPNCGAPQIRVTGLAGEPAPSSTPSFPPGAPGEMQPPAQPAPFGEPSRPVSVDWSQALPGAAIAGVVVAIAWILPFTAVCLWVLAGGALSVALYHRRRPDAPFTPGAGARLGALTGLLGFLVFGIAFSLQVLLLGGGAQMRQALRRVIEESAARSPDPRSQEAMEMLLRPEGLALMITLLAVVFLAGFLLFGAIGGALGAALFRKHRSQ